MKTIITALVAMTFTLTAMANHTHTAACPVNCSQLLYAVAPVAKSYEQKLAEIKLASDDKLSRMHYSQTMQRTLNLLETQKHESAIENLKAENAYNNLMVNLLSKMEEERLTDQLEDVAAAERFELLMGKILMDTASK
ncbi:MAG TPA: hypothetical protein VK907_02945 [Phnomibacter sp.]|nr:hypothetical protein [Phnomibacter sp.]